jgi:hypothetical protein
MTIHRAKLRSHDYTAEDGTVVPMVFDDIPIGTDYLVHMGHPGSGLKKMFNRDLLRTFEVNHVWVETPDGVGLFPAQCLDIDEAPLPADYCEVKMDRGPIIALDVEGRLHYAKTSKGLED